MFEADWVTGRLARLGPRQRESAKTGKKLKKRKKEGRRGPISDELDTRAPAHSSYLLLLVLSRFLSSPFSLLLLSSSQRQCSSKHLHDSYQLFLDPSRTHPRSSLAGRSRTRLTDPFLVRRPKCLRRLSSPRRRLSVSAPSAPSAPVVDELVSVFSIRVETYCTRANFSQPLALT